MTHQQKIAEFLTAAFECTIYLAPTDIWLTYDELLEVGRASGYLDGEIRDAIPLIALQNFGKEKKLKPTIPGYLWGIFVFAQEPDFRNYRALDFVVTELNRTLREVGAHDARLERGTLVERANAGGISRLDTEASITLLVVTGALEENDGVVWLKARRLYEPLPSAQRQSGSGQTMISEARKRAYPLVKDVITRRSQGSSIYAEPLDSFAEMLKDLGYGPFRAWWTLTVNELRRADPSYHLLVRSYSRLLWWKLH
jgi:hypothetical protein